MLITTVSVKFSFFVNLARLLQVVFLYHEVLLVIKTISVAKLNICTYDD